mmetsp:Transcript_49176/g.123245  ORF Transcript_49176/g.123245 Transcript_49176/m.123245 type:complete len:173 (-) Transcript_49176:100-618(-)
MGHPPCFPLFLFFTAIPLLNAAEKLEGMVLKGTAVVTSLDSLTDEDLPGSCASLPPPCNSCGNSFCNVTVSEKFKIYGALEGTLTVTASASVFENCTDIKKAAKELLISSGTALFKDEDGESSSKAIWYSINDPRNPLRQQAVADLEVIDGSGTGEFKGYVEVIEHYRQDQG